MMRSVRWWPAGAFLLMGTMVAGCSGEDQDDDDDSSQASPPPSSGDGIIHRDGQAIPYTIDADQTKLLLLVRLVEGCILPFHSHVIESTSTAFTFELDADSPSVSSFTATVYVDGLEADLEENLPLYPETEHNDFSASEREDIEESMNDQIEADDYETMTFAAHDLSSLNGNGTAKVSVTIKGKTTEMPIHGSVTFDDAGTVTIVASGVLDGEPYDIYNGFGESCIDSQMPVDLTLVMKPGN